MILFCGIFVWVNAWIADRSFRERRYVWGSVAAAMSVTCFVFWLRGVAS